MSTIATTLRECHRLRKHLKAIKEEIERGPRVLKAHTARMAAEETLQKEHHELVKKLKLQQKDLEGTLRQTETRLTKLEQQLLGISVKKEYDAKQSEIAQAQEKKNELEEQILSLMGTIEEKVAAIPLVEKQLADARAEFGQFQIDAKSRLERLNREHIEAQELLAKHDSSLPPRFRTLYDFQVKSHGPDALAAVKDKVCEGCHTGMTDQHAMEVMNGAFSQCRSCGRILYPAE